MNVSPNKRYLGDDGRPFFYLADTAWKLLTTPTAPEAPRYLRSAFVTRGAWDGTGNIRTPAAIAGDRCFAVICLPEQMPVWVDLLPPGRRSHRGHLDGPAHRHPDAHRPLQPRGGAPSAARR